MSTPFENVPSRSEPEDPNEYNWTFDTGPSARLFLSNPRGEVRIAGWERPEVQIHAIKRTDDRARSQMTRVVAEQKDSSIIVRTITDQISRLVEGGGLWGIAQDVIQALADLVSLGTPAPVSYIVQVPFHSDLEVNGVSSRLMVSGVEGGERIRSVSGGIEATNLRGDVDLTTVSGEVEGRDLSGRVSANSVSGEIQLAGSIANLRAKTVSGRIEVSGPLATDGHYLFNSVSGDVTLRIPMTAHATFHAKGVSLNVHSELREGLTAQTGRAPGRSQWIAELNGGGAIVRFHTVSGAFALRVLGEQPSPTVPNPPMPTSPLATPAEPPPALIAESEQMRILKALERGEMSVDEATWQLEALKRGPSGEGENHG
ncbi:MAG TPA: hypothetical protein VKX96_09260 [Chloroflexota bacterium]|nr:hypothetical protein [Chloroflexota bacterium]